jgi:predicted helicase
MTQTPFQQMLSTFRSVSKSEREKGTYFEELIRTYLRHEPIYADLYSGRDCPKTQSGTTFWLSVSSVNVGWV